MEGVARQKRVIRIELLAGLRQEAGGRKYVEVEAEDWREALRKLREMYPGLRSVISEKGEPEAGYLVFVDGVDYRLKEPGPAEKVVILPVNHGGEGAPELLHVSWDDIEETVSDVARKIEESGFRPHVIVGVMRGGVVPARLIADALGVMEIGIMEVKLYKGVGVRGSKPYLKRPLIEDVLNKDVLVVDDVSDSGLTLQLAVNVVSLHGARRIKTATLYIKPWTKLVPDYYSRSTDKWVVFPWEKNEVMRELSSRGSASGYQAL
ncbi:hypothetical protein JCM10135_09460 [Stetteria hydrogenophila]